MKRAYDLSDDTDQEDRCPDCGGCDCIVGECLAQVDACGYCDACGGTDYTMRVRDGHRVCISCVEVEREDAESARARDASHLDDADAKLSAMRKALTMAGVPESEPYPDDAVSDWERSLRTGGYMIGGVTRIQRLATERDAARTELAKVTAERDDARAELATAKKDHIFWRDRRMEICDERDRENAKLATAVAYLATVTAERDNLRQHVALTTRGDGLDDLRVRLANAAIAWGEVLDEDKAYYAEEDAGLLVDELAKAIRAKLAAAAKRAEEAEATIAEFRKEHAVWSEVKRIQLDEKDKLIGELRCDLHLLEVERGDEVARGLEAEDKHKATLARLAAVEAVIAALPKCEVCDAPATREVSFDHDEERYTKYYCDAHASWDSKDTWAAEELRAYLALVEAQR